MNIDTSVILAAGLGIRLRNLIGETPKGLLKISGIPLLQRSINLLEEQGIDKVYVVTGFKHAVLEKTLIEWELGPEIYLFKIQIIRNPVAWNPCTTWKTLFRGIFCYWNPTFSMNESPYRCSFRPASRTRC